MDEYTTTYKKDYLWPNRKEPLIDESSLRSHTCRCDATNVGKETYYANANNDSYEWSRLGPMGQLLEPKLYPVKICANPEIDIAKIDRSNVDKEKLPDKCHISQGSSRQIITNYINLDRPKTTYEMDYGHSNKPSPMNNYNFPTNVNVNGEKSQSCSAPIQIPDIERRPPIRQRAVNREDSASREKSQKRLRSEKNGELEAKSPPWTSEYQDVISRTGNVIIKKRMHRQRGIPAKSNNNYLPRKLKPCP